MAANIWNQPGEQAYPIASFTYLIVYRDLNNLPDKGAAQDLANFLWWATHDGQRYAADLDYAPLAPEVQGKVEEALKRSTTKDSRSTSASNVNRQAAAKQDSQAGQTIGAGAELPPPAAPVAFVGCAVAAASPAMPSLAGCSRLGAVSIIVMLVVLLSVLSYAAWPSIETFGWSFLFTSQWRPNELNVPARDAAGHVIIEDGEVVMKTIPPVFGALPVIYGTAVSSLAGDPLRGAAELWGGVVPGADESALDGRAGVVSGRVSGGDPVDRLWHVGPVRACAVSAASCRAGDLRTAGLDPRRGRLAVHGNGDAWPDKP